MGVFINNLIAKFINNALNKYRMPTTMLIIGNGFDLSLGLRSSFKEFFGIDQGTYHMLKSDIDDIRNNCNKFDKRNPTFKSLYVLKYINYINIKLELLTKSKSKELDTISNIKDQYKKANDIKGDDLSDLNDDKNTLFSMSYITDKKRFTSKENFNFWSLYFIILKYEGDSDWYDVEHEIHDFLTCKNNYYYLICIYLYNVYSKNGENQNDKEFVNIYNKIKNVPYSIKTDVNIIIYALSKRHSTKHVASLIKIIKQGSIKSFKDMELLFNKYLKIQLHQFEYTLNDYLFGCIKRYKRIYGFSYYSMGEELLNCLTYNSRFLSLLNFNYTDPTHNYKRICKFRRNVHGILNKNHNTRISPIIGISDPKIKLDNSDNSIYSFTKDYRILRLSCNNYSDFLQDGINDIRFFGHSFDKEDRHYFYDIFDKYKIINGNTKLIFYYKPYGEQNDNSGAINQINSVVDLFKDYFNRRCKKGNGSEIAIKFMDDLSLSGQLIITNIDDEIKRRPKLYKKFKVVNNVHKLFHEMAIINRNDCSNKDIKKDLNKIDIILQHIKSFDSVIYKCIYLGIKNAHTTTDKQEVISKDYNNIVESFNK